MFDLLMDKHDWFMLFLRLVVGFIFIWHGWPKFRTPEAMASGMNWPKALVMVLGIVEMVAGIGIITGVLIQWAGLLGIIVMLGALYHQIFKWKAPFWSMTSTGWEFDLLLLASLLLIVSHGTPELSLMGY